MKIEDLEIIKQHEMKEIFRDPKKIAPNYLAKNGETDETLLNKVANKIDLDPESITELSVGDMRKLTDTPAVRSKNNLEELQERKRKQYFTRLTDIRNYMHNAAYQANLKSGHAIPNEYVDKLLQIQGNILSMLDSGFRDILRSVPRYERNMFSYRLVNSLLSTCTSIDRALFIGSVVMSELKNADINISDSINVMKFMYLLRFCSLEQFEYYAGKLLDARTKLGGIIKELRPLGFK